MHDFNIEEIKQNLINQLNAVSKDILENFPVFSYIELFKEYPQYISHKFVSVKVEEITTKIINLSDMSSLETYHKLVLVTFIQLSIEGSLINTFPNDIKVYFFNNFNLILDKVIAPKNKRIRFLHSDDTFSKYLNITRLKMIPCGTQKIYAGSLPKRFLFTGGIFQLFRGVFFISKSGGIKPFYKLHTDSTDKQLMREFNADGWDRLFKRIGQLLKTEKNIKGVCGVSWVFDIALKEISPELGYIRRISKNYGASFFYQGTDKSCVKDAIFMSPKRIKLYKQGLYMPKNYLMVISRENLIKKIN